MNKETIKINRSRLVGQVTVSGAKNSALRLLAASILTDEKIELFNFPSQLLDIQIHLEMLGKIGKNYHSENVHIIISENDSGGPMSKPAHVALFNTRGSGNGCENDFRVKPTRLTKKCAVFNCIYSKYIQFQNKEGS